MAAGEAIGSFREGSIDLETMCSYWLARCLLMPGQGTEHSDDDDEEQCDACFCPELDSILWYVVVCE